MCDPEEEETKAELDRRSFVVGAASGFGLALLGFLVAAKQSLLGGAGPAPIQGGPYNIPQGDGKYTFVDVSGLWNDVGITNRTNKKLSNFDEQGTAFAQEDLGQLRTRIEAFLEMIQSAKQVFATEVTQ